MTIGLRSVLVIDNRLGSTVVCWVNGDHVPILISTHHARRIMLSTKRAEMEKPGAWTQATSEGTATGNTSTIGIVAVMGTTATRGATTIGMMTATTDGSMMIATADGSTTMDMMVATMFALMVATMTGMVAPTTATMTDTMVATTTDLMVAPTTDSMAARMTVTMVDMTIDTTIDMPIGTTMGATIAMMAGSDPQSVGIDVAMMLACHIRAMMRMGQTRTTAGGSLSASPTTLSRCGAQVPMVVRMLPANQLGRPR